MTAAVANREMPRALFWAPCFPVAVEIPPRSSQSGDATIQLSGTALQKTVKTVRHNPLGAHPTSQGVDQQLTHGFSMERPWEGSRRGSTTAAASPEAFTPFATSFASATDAAGGSSAATITGPEAFVANADRTLIHARIGPSASMPAPTTGGLFCPTTSVSVCRPLASPLTSPSAAYGIRMTDTAGAGPGASGGASAGGTLVSARPSSNATDFCTPIPAASSTVGERRIQRLLQKIDSVCSNSAHNAVSTRGVGTNVPYDYDNDVVKRLYGKSNPSSPSQRLDEQGLRELLMMLPASPEVVARVDMMSQPPPPPATAEPVALAAGGGHAAAAAGIEDIAGDLTSLAVLSSLPQVQLPTDKLGGAAKNGASIERVLAAIAPEDGDEDTLTARGEVPVRELGLVGSAGPSSGLNEILEPAAAAAAVVEPPVQLIELTPRPALVGNLVAVSEARRSSATALTGRRTEPGGRTGDALAGGGGGGGGDAAGSHACSTDGDAATGWAMAVGGGGGSNGNGYVDVGPKFLRSSSSSFNDAPERELSLRQLVPRGLVDRGRGSARLVGSASTSAASRALASHVLGDGTPAMIASTPPSSLPPPQAASPAAVSSVDSQSMGHPLRSRSHKAWGSGDGSSCGGGGCEDGITKAGSTPQGVTGGSSSDSDSDSDGLADFLDSAVGRPATATSADRRRCMVSEQAAYVTNGTVDGPYTTRQRRQHHRHNQPQPEHPLQLQLQQQHRQEAEGSGEPQQHGEQEDQQRQQQQDSRTMLRGRSHHWAPLHPKPPSRARRASAHNYSAAAAWVSTAAQPPRSPPLPSPPPQSPPLPSPPPPRPAFAGGDGAMISSSSAGAATGLDADGSSSLAEEPRRGAVPTSPLQARLFVGTGRSNRSLSEPSSSLRDPAGSGLKFTRPSSPPSPVYGSGGGADDEDENSPSSDWDFEVRQIGPTAPGGSKLAVASTPSPPSAPAAEAAANLVALIDENLNRNSNAVSVSSGTRTYQDGFRPLSPPPPDAMPITPASPPLIYPHPPPAFPSPCPPSATTASPAAAEVTATLQRAMCVRSQRRPGTSQLSLKHFGNRLETLEEEGHPRSVLSAADAAAAGGDSSSSGGGGGPWSTASGTSNTDGIGGRRQSLRNFTRRSTSSTPRHLHRRRRLTGEPGESSSDGSSSGSSDDEYLQTLFRPLRHAPPQNGANNPTSAHPADLTWVGQAALCTAQINAGAGDILPSTASSDLRSSHSLRFHSRHTGHHVQPPLVLPAPSSPPLPPPSPPPVPSPPPQQHDLTWARRPSLRVCSTGSAGASGGGAAAASGKDVVVTTLAVYHAPGGRDTATTSATVASQPLALRVPAGVAAAPAAGSSAAVAVHEWVGDGANGQLGGADSISELSTEDSQTKPLNIDRIKHDLERLLAK